MKDREPIVGYIIHLLLSYNPIFLLDAPGAMRYQSALPKSKICNRKFPISAFRLPPSNHSCVCSRKKTTGFLRRIAIEGSNPIVTTSNTVAVTSKILANING